MNYLLTLRHCRDFVRKIYGDLFRHSYYFEYSSKVFGTQSISRLHLNYVPIMCSYNQIREYAKRAQGKMPKSKTKKMHLTDEEMADVIDVEDYREQLNNIGERLKKEYIDNLSTRSAVGNIENIIVKIDEEDYPLNELAVISKKNPTLIAINMSDFPEALKPAIQAIIDSGSGFNPQQEGTMIYLSVPKMTREHRENLAKNAKTLYLKAKEEIRAIQNSFVKEAKEKTDLSEDLIFSATNQIMMMAEQCAADLEKILKAKQKELLGDS